MNRLLTTAGASAAVAAAALAVAPGAGATLPGRDGGIAFTSVRSGQSYDLYLMGPSGKVIRRLTRTKLYNESQPAWSPDGRKLAYVRRSWVDENHPGPFEIWTMRADGTHRRYLSRGTEPTWSPDGRRIAYVYRLGPRISKPDIWVMRADGTGERRLTNNGNFSDRSPDWSPDGKWIAFFSDRGKSRDVWKMRPDGSGATRLTEPGPWDDNPSWSPDGKLILFTSGSLRDGFVLTTMRPDGSHKTPLRGIQGRDPSWSPSGRSVLFLRYGPEGGNSDIFRVGFASGDPVNLTAGSKAFDQDPAWRPVR